MLKLDFSLFEQTSHLRLVPNMGWGVSEQCWIYQVLCGVSLNSRISHILFVPKKIILKNSTYRTNIIQGDLTCIKDYYLQLGHYKTIGVETVRFNGKHMRKITFYLTAKKYFST